MSRFTAKNESICNYCEYERNNGCIKTDPAKCVFNITWNKLNHYEDLEEAGRLIELPCNIGDTMWRVVEMSTGKTQTAIKKFVRIVTLTENNAFDISRKFGKTVFLTKAEAEQKLEELKGGASQ